MNGYNKANIIEALGEERLLSVIQQYSPLRKITDKLGQDTLGDYEFNGCYHEFKFEEKYTGNLFLESWSNKSRNKVGWMFKPMEAIFLWYGFLNKGIVYCINFVSLKDWFKENQYKYKEIMQSKYVQSNDTYGRIIPLKDITKFYEEQEF